MPICKCQGMPCRESQPKGKPAVAAPLGSAGHWLCGQRQLPAQDKWMGKRRRKERREWEKQVKERRRKKRGRGRRKDRERRMRGRGGGKRGGDRR